MGTYALFLQGVVYNRQQQIKFTHSRATSPMYRISAGGSNCNSCSITKQN